MKVIIFNGSHRGDKGNTQVMIDAFMEGVSEAGGQVESVVLKNKKILPCEGCYACWLKTPNQCIHDDDMPELLGKFMDADAVAFATPLYIFTMTGLMKVFMDRLIAWGDPHMERVNTALEGQEDRWETRHIKIGDKPGKFIVISNCGYPEQTHFEALSKTFELFARNCQCEVIAEIYRGGGALLTARDPALRPFIDSYKDLLRKAGREVVDNLRLSDETRTELEAPLLPGDFANNYVLQANKMFDAILRRP
jgi:multimeric flavodoxin WrbA